MKVFERLNQSITSILLSYSQIFFSDRKIMGLLLVIVSVFNFSAGISGLIAIITVNITAWLMQINTQKIISGQYGFNALLVGLGLGVYYHFNHILFLILIFASILTFLLTLFFEGWLAKYKLPFLSLPFLVALWIVSLSTQQFTGLALNETGVFSYNDIVTNFNIEILNLHFKIQDLGIPISIITYFNSLAAIFFQYNIYAGILIAVGLLTVSRISFMLSVLGFYSAYFYYLIVGADFTELNYSYIGFNYILTAIAVGGFFVIPSVFSFLWVIFLTPVISFIMTSSNQFLGLVGLSTLSLPFNIVVILFLYSLMFRERTKRGVKFTIVQYNSPEKNLYNYFNFKSRFGTNPLVSLALPFFGTWKISQSHKGSYTHQGKWQHAWDFVMEENEKEYTEKGYLVEDYYCYGKMVLAAADGVVEAIADGIEDNIIGEVNLKQNWGNSIVIKHDHRLYSQISHIKAGSFKVKVGDFVKKGQPLALVGNSGRSPFPHIHFQIQTTPFIGSETIDYPLANYIVEEEIGEKLYINCIPKENQFIRNVEADKVLKTSFGFIPGQELVLSEDGKELIWKIEIDYFNNTFIHCMNSNSKAYFINTDNRLTFTGFKGSKKTTLFRFYLAAFHVIFAWNKNIQIIDYLPANTIRNYKTLVQDFIAPFYIFIKPKYRMDYIEKESYFDESKIKIKSTLNLSRKYTFVNEFLLNEKGLEEWKISENNKEINYKFIRD